MAQQPQKLLVLDIDNTVFDWVSYYVNSMEALFAKVSSIIGVEPSLLASEARIIFTAHGSIEYPFLIQELASVNDYYKSDITAMLNEAVEPGREAFNSAARDYLKPYDGVIETLQQVRNTWPKLPIVALTDAPRYVAMWKLNKLGLLSSFDAIYGLPDPKIPVDHQSQQVKVHQEILLKHLSRQDFDFPGKVRTLPEEYEKPGTRGLRTVLMDFEMEDKLDRVLWVGDNLRKDVGLGTRLGIHSAWAEFGTHIASEVKDRLLAFSPETNVHKNVALDPRSPESPVPDSTLKQFSDLIPAIESILH